MYHIVHCCVVVAFAGRDDILSYKIIGKCGLGTRRITLFFATGTVPVACYSFGDEFRLFEVALMWP